VADKQNATARLLAVPTDDRLSHELDHFSDREHALSEDEIDVVALADPAARPHVHLGAQRPPFGALPAVASHAIGCADPEIRSHGFGACYWGKQGRRQGGRGLSEVSAALSGLAGTRNLS